MSHAETVAPLTKAQTEQLSVLFNDFDQGKMLLWDGEERSECHVDQMAMGC